MTPEERPNLRYPLLWRGGLDRILFVAFKLLMAWTATRGHLIEPNPDGSRTLSNLAILTAYIGFASFFLWPVFWFFRTDFVFDEDGVALKRRKRRMGLSWDEIAMYDWHGSVLGSYLHLTDKSGRKHTLRLPANADFHQSAIQGTLDFYLASRGHPIELKIPAHELGIRLARPRATLPTLEMEPNVRYRYVNPDVLKTWVSVSGWWVLLLIFSIPFVMLVVKTLTGSLEMGLLAMAVYAIPALGYSLFRKAEDARFLRHFDDRFLLRENTLYVINNGVERPLPPGEPSGRRLMGHIFTKHGKGRSGYEMAPQFLEPDPDANR